MTAPLENNPEAVAPKIYTIRDEPVVLDSDLALLYGVETGQFNRALKRMPPAFRPTSPSNSRQTNGIL